MRNLIPFVLMLSACSSVTPGHVKLKVNLTGTEENRYEIIRGGWVFPSPNADYYEIPTTEQRVVWTNQEGEGANIDEAIYFSGKDGQQVSADFGLTYHIAPDDASIIKMVKLYTVDVNHTVHTMVRDSVRNSLQVCSSQFKVEELYGTAREEILKCVTEKVSAQYSPNGLVISQVTMNSAVRLPAQIQQALEASIAATQQADKTRREVEQSIAEGEKRVAAAKAAAEAKLIEANAEAEANRIRSASITPSILEMERIKTERLKVEKWGGAVPQTVLGDSSGIIVSLDSLK